MNLKAFVLIGILLLGAYLRTLCLGHGLPETHMNDEMFEVHRALSLLVGEFNFERFAKGFYFYILAFVYLIDALVGIFSGKFTSIYSYVTEMMTHPGHAIFIGRVVTAALGTWSIYLVYRLAKVAIPDLSTPFQLFAAFLWAICSLAVWNASWSLIETCLTTFSILAFIHILRILENPKSSQYIISAILIAVAASSKLYGSLLLLALLQAHLFRIQSFSLKNVISSLSDRKLYLAILVFFVAWTILIPSLPYKIFDTIQKIIMPGDYTESGIQETSNFGYYFNRVRWRLGSLMIPFLAFGILHAIINKKKQVVILSTFSIIFVMAIAFPRTDKHVYERYILMSLPFFQVIIVYGIFHLTRLVMPIFKSKNQKLVNLSIIGILSIFAVWDSFGYFKKTAMFKGQFVTADSQAKAWIERNIPEKTKIAMFGNPLWPTQHTVPLYDLSENYQELAKNPSLPHYATAAEMHASIDYYPRFDLVVFGKNDFYGSLEDCIDEGGIQVFIIQEKYFLPNPKKSRLIAAHKSRVELYKSLKEMKKVKRLKTFSGTTIQGGSNTVIIFAVNSLKLSDNSVDTEGTEHTLPSTSTD